MTLYLPPDSRRFLETIWAIAEANPFGLKRVQLEAQALGRPLPEEILKPTNLSTCNTTTDEVNSTLRDCLQELKSTLYRRKNEIADAEKNLYRTGVWFWVYHHLIPELDAYLEQCRIEPEKSIRFGNDRYREYRNELGTYLELIDGSQSAEDILQMNEDETAELFAFCFQLRRGFNGILHRIVGGSPSACKLRADVWEAIFTRRLLWSLKYLKDRMANFSTLILGESGSGKDLVAEAIGTAQFIPYLPGEDRFADNFINVYHVVNLSALTPTLIESELFGHMRGAFTGATENRKGFLEQCSPYGALFLDEIGELSAEIQVKLLRVLQSREFYPLGGGKPVRFHGRILTATNRDITTLVQEGRMREDFLYRLGAVVIRVPTLYQRFSEYPEEAAELLHILLQRILGHTDDSVYHELIERILPLTKSGYPWPGNVREFEQCIRSMLVASHYDPLVAPQSHSGSLPHLLSRMENTEATLEDVMIEYCRHAFQQTGSYQKAAERLNTDWRTIKKYVSRSA